MPDGKPFRVLSLDGGGMRGTYTATYLSCLEETFARRRNEKSLDIGKGFDLIVGTSTGGIIACALAAGVPLPDVVQLYRKYGAAIFPSRLPTGGLGLWRDLRHRPKDLENGSTALRTALLEKFGDTTLAAIFARRGIALAIPAIELGQHRSWVFKTAHLAGSNHRDDDYTLVDVCLATSSAPIYRSLTAIDHPNTGLGGHHVFADGGLWANNPVLVGLIDALEMATAEQEIEVYCLGTCPRPAGENVPRAAVNRGLWEWKFGGDAASLSIDAQEFAFDNMARMLAKHLDRKCEILRFPRDQIPASLIEFLDLDDTRPEAIDALINQARTDANMTNSRCGDEKSHDGQMINRLFMDLPPRTPAA
jgi:hypothetical protein